MRFRLYPPQNLIDGGNHATASRWMEILNSLGHDTSICEFKSEELVSGEVHFFFNAAKSADRVGQVHSRFSPSDSKVIVVLSGTDLQSNMLELPETQAAMDFADALVVYERSALEKLTQPQLAKTVVIPHSSRSRSLPDFEFNGGLNIISVSHIRPQKNLARYFRCLKNFSDESGLTFHHIGGAIDDQTTTEVESIAAEIDYLKLHGQKSHLETLAMIRAADMLIHPSLVEGFPNVVVEAIVNQTAVAVSRIPAHTTTFADCLPEELFFDTDCGVQLQTLIQNFIRDPMFRDKVQQACASIAGQFRTEVERNSLVELLHETGTIG